MAYPPMDSLYEQRLRDEVIYLHSLWHQGPPRPPAAAARRHLQPSKATQFKKKNKRGNKKGKKSTSNTNTTAPESDSSPWAEWPCPRPPPPTTGWPSLEVKPKPEPPLSANEQLKLAGKHAHRLALTVVQQFFTSNNADDSHSVVSSSDEDNELMEEEYGREMYSFFFNVFKEDKELREYYEKNFAKGEFGCLVCGAVGGKKTGKKFKGCLPLVQHSITIANTKKRRAHRAFGQAVCKVLGWDIDQLPATVSMLNDRPGGAQGNGIIDDEESSMTCLDNVDSVRNDTLEGRNEEAAPETRYTESGRLADGDEGNVNPLTCPDADKNLENRGMVHARNMEEPASDGLTNNPLTCVDADKNLENLGMVYQYDMEEPASLGLTINFSTLSGADRNLANPGVLHPHNMEDTGSEWLRNVPLNGNNPVRNGTQDL